MPISTWVEVDLDRFARNLERLRALAGSERELLLVAKADAYGHGAVEMARAAEGHGVTRFGVATLHEGLQLRAAQCHRPIIVLSPLLPAEAEEAVAHGLEPTVADLDLARALSDVAQRSARPTRVHVEVDTGMGRTGVREEEVVAFLRALAALPGLRIASVYTHFPDAEADDLGFARAQLGRFAQLLAHLEALGLRPPRTHAANSAGFLNLPEARLDWARLGLAAYGVQPSRADAGLVLEPVMSLRSRLVQVRTLPAGTPISYSRTFVTARTTRVGVVPVGYGHGYSWLLSNRGRMLVGGRSAPILGRVTMDLTMVDLTDHAEAAVGDEVVLFGEQGAESLPIGEVARASETLPYEVLCTIGKRVTRLYVRGGAAASMSTLVGEREAWTQAATEYLRERAHAAALGAP